MLPPYTVEVFTANFSEAKRLHLAGEFKRARRLYQDLADRHPEETGPRLMLAELDMRDGKLAAARAELEVLSKRHPEFEGNPFGPGRPERRARRHGSGDAALPPRRGRIAQQPDRAFPAGHCVEARGQIGRSQGLLSPSHRRLARSVGWLCRLDRDGPSRRYRRRHRGDTGDGPRAAHRRSRTRSAPLLPRHRLRPAQGLRECLRGLRRSQQAAPRELCLAVHGCGGGKSVAEGPRNGRNPPGGREPAEAVHQRDARDVHAAISRAFRQRRRAERRSDLHRRHAALRLDPARADPRRATRMPSASAKPRP